MHYHDAEWCGSMAENGAYEVHKSRSDLLTFF